MHSYDLCAALELPGPHPEFWKEVERQRVLEQRVLVYEESRKAAVRPDVTRTGARSLEVLFGFSNRKNRVLRSFRNG